MHELLNTMVPMTPVGLAFIACIAFGMALGAREALGVERGMRLAAEHARAAALKTLSANRDWEMDEVGRFRRLLDCHIETIIAEATNFRERSVPSPGATLESLASWNPDWKRDLARSAELQADEVDKLLKSDLPMTPGLARKLELFTGAPARFWERLARLHDEYRTETDKTVMLLIESAVRAEQGAPPRRPVLALIDESATAAETSPAPWSDTKADAELPAVLQVQAPPRRPGRSELTGGPQAQRVAVEMPPPAMAQLDIADRGSRLPPPPKPRLRSPIAPADTRAPERRANTPKSFPIQVATSLQANGADWNEVEASPLNETLPGVGDHRSS